MESIQQNFETIKQTIEAKAQECGRDPEGIRIIAVSKTRSAQTVKDAVNAGVEIFGENYIQEAVQKIEALENRPVSWHFIGHLQSNKAKHAVPAFDLIHTVDRIKLAKEINRQAEKNGKIQEILIQVNIGEEDTKSGASREDALSLAK